MTDLTQEQIAKAAASNAQLPAGVVPGYERPNGEHYWPETGLTKRELFAAMVLQGLLSNEHFELSTPDNAIVAKAAEYADKLLKELVK